MIYPELSSYISGNFNAEITSKLRMNDFKEHPLISILQTVSSDLSDETKRKYVLPSTLDALERYTGNEESKKIVSLFRRMSTRADMLNKDRIKRFYEFYLECELDTAEKLEEFRKGLYNNITLHEKKLKAIIEYENKLALFPNR